MKGVNRKREIFNLKLTFALVLCSLLVGISDSFPSGDGVQIKKEHVTVSTPEYYEFLNETETTGETNIPVPNEETGTEQVPVSSTTQGLSTTTIGSFVLPQPTTKASYKNTSTALPDNFTRIEFEDSIKETNEVGNSNEDKDNPSGKNANNVSKPMIATVGDYPGEGVSSTTSASIFVPAPAQTGIDPSIQLLPPPPPSQVTSSVLSASPSTVSPRNLKEIPLSLVSLSGNSGGSEEGNLPTQTKRIVDTNIRIDFTQYRYHVETGKLIKIGSTGAGVCPPNMRFFAVPGHPKNGACDCDYYQCSRPLIYSLEKHQCYFAWSKGPCNEGEWLVFNRDLHQRGLCEKNPCNSNNTESDTNNGYLPTPPPSYSTYLFHNPNDGKCYEAGSNGYCQDRDERLLIFPGDEPIPTCRKYTFCYPLTVPQELQCIYGSKYYLESGRC